MQLVNHRLFLRSWIVTTICMGVATPCALFANSQHRVDLETPLPLKSIQPSFSPSPGNSPSLPKPVALITPKSSSHSTSSIPQLLFEIENKYTQAGTISAHFTQSEDNKTLGKKKISTGTIQVKRPRKIRWETEKPDPNLLVSNGKIFWFYTPPFDEGEPGQLIERKASEVQSQIATALLSGEFSKVKGIRVQKKSDASFIITPKTGTAGTVLRALIELDLAQLLIQKVTLYHRGGNTAEITLSQIELGNPLKDDLFQFKAPPNTDRVR